MATSSLSSLDLEKVYTSQCGRILSLKESSGYIEWSTEQGAVCKLRIHPAEINNGLRRTLALGDGDVVQFTAEYDITTGQWIAHHIKPAQQIDGVVYMGSDKKLFIKSGPMQTHYSLSPSDCLAGAIKIRPSDEVLFFAAAPTFGTCHSILRATHVSILAHGVIDCLVQDPKCMGVYVRWRKCEDVAGQSPLEERIYHMLDLPSIEPKYYIPGLRCTLSPLLLLKKRTKKLNLTSKFGTFTAYADGSVIKLPKPDSPGQIRIVKHNSSTLNSNHSSIIPFSVSDVVSSQIRSTRIGDKVEVQMGGHSPTKELQVSVSVVLEGIIESSDDGGGESNHLVAISDGTRYPLDANEDKAVVGFVPLVPGDKVKFHVGQQGTARHILVLGEVEGRVYAPGLIRVRGSPISAIYSPKANGGLKSGDSVALRLEWKATHFCAVNIRSIKQAAKYVPSSPLAKQPSSESMKPFESPRAPSPSPQSASVSPAGADSPRREELIASPTAPTAPTASTSPPAFVRPLASSGGSTVKRRLFSPREEPEFHLDGGEVAYEHDDYTVPAEQTFKIERPSHLIEPDPSDSFAPVAGLATADGSLPRFMGGLELPVEDQSYFSDGIPGSLINREHDQVVPSVRSPPGFKRSSVPPIGPPLSPWSLGGTPVTSVESSPATTPRVVGAPPSPSSPGSSALDSVNAKRFFSTGDISRFIEEMGRLDASNLGDMIEQFEYGVEPTYEDDSFSKSQMASPPSKYAPNPAAGQRGFGSYMPPVMPLSIPSQSRAAPHPPQPISTSYPSSGPASHMYGQQFSPPHPSYVRFVAFASPTNQPAPMPYWPSQPQFADNAGGMFSGAAFVPFSGAS